jgi:hypothetical protein
MCWQRLGNKAARFGRYKWVQSTRGKGLFDLSVDISERHDLSRDKPGLLRQLRARFTAWEEKMAEAEPRGPFRDY